MPIARRRARFPHAAALLLSLSLAAMACSSSAATGSSVGTTTTLPPTSTSVLQATTSTASGASTSTSTSASASTSSSATATSEPADPTFQDTPDGRCATLAPGSIGFRNTTGHVADQYTIIGESTEARRIWAEHWGSRTGAQVLVLGQVHGDECAPAWLVRAIREQPPTDFGIWLVPTVNPDGLADYTRHTALDLDPNRDGFNLATPEAQAVMHATELFRPVLTVHLHSPYKWVGAHNGPLAVEVAAAMSTAAGWGPPSNAGRVNSGTLAFLWEGQERVIPGNQSVLVEFPSISPLEAPTVPDPTQRDEGSVAEVATAADRMRDALYLVMASHATG